MRDYITIARPYARAAFEYAVEHKQIPAWSEFLQTAASVVEDKRVSRLLNNPSINYTDKQQFILDVCKDANAEHRNFIAALAQFHRLNIIPAVAALFEDFCKERNKSMEVEVLSAYPLEEQQIKRLQKALAIRLQRDVTLNILLDKNLIGGAQIRAGDFVIDGSSRGQLQRLSKILID